MGKYKGTDDTSKQNTKDTIIDDNSKIAFQNEDAELTRKSLIKWFNEFDKNAILYADKYRSTIYLRAVIPLIITIALAIGFYTETLLSPWQINIQGGKLQIWSIIAGLAFFTHALLNFYVFKISENTTIKAIWKNSFLHRFYICIVSRKYVGVAIPSMGRLLFIKTYIV